MYRVNRGAVGGPEQLLDYYHVEAEVCVPEGAGPEELAAYLNENTPLICVPATLDGAWYRTLSCPMLAWDRDGLCHGLVPGRLGRACDPGGEKGRRVYITAKNCGGFRREGYAVQRDLPGKAPSIWAALGRLLRGMGGLETAGLLLWSVLGGGLLLLLGGLLQEAVNDAVLRSELSAAGACGAAAGAAAGLVLWYVGRRMADRISRRAALGLLPALGKRVWFNPSPGSPAGTADRLASLREDGELLVRWALTPLCGLGVGLLPAVGLTAALPGLAWSACATAGGLALAAVGALGLGAVWKAGGRTEAEYEWLESRTSDKRFGIERPFPFGQEDGGGAWAGGPLRLALPLLMAPVLFAAAEEGLGLAGLVWAAALYLPAVVFPLAMLEGALRAGRGLASLRELLRRGAGEPGHDRELPKLGSALELKNVTFTYPGRREPVLRDVDLRVFPGEVLGIAGRTGAGKAALARIMAGLLVPEAGNVYYGGVELGRFARESVLRRIAPEDGEDIRLLDHAPEELDGRTTVVFSAREEELARCERIFDLSEGRLTLRKQKGQYMYE